MKDTVIPCSCTWCWNEMKLHHQQSPFFLFLSMPLSASTGILLSANISSFSESSLYWCPFLSRYTWFPERTSARKRYGKDCQNVPLYTFQDLPRRNTDPHQKRFIFFPSPPHSSVTCHCLKQKFQCLTLSLQHKLGSQSFLSCLSR